MPRKAARRSRPRRSRAAARRRARRRARAGARTDDDRAAPESSRSTRAARALPRNRVLGQDDADRLAERRHHAEAERGGPVATPEARRGALVSAWEPPDPGRPPPDPPAGQPADDSMPPSVRAMPSAPRPRAAAGRGGRGQRREDRGDRPIIIDRRTPIRASDSKKQVSPSAIPITPERASCSCASSERRPRLPSVGPTIRPAERPRRAERAPRRARLHRDSSRRPGAPAFRREEGRGDRPEKAEPSANAVGNAAGDSPRIPEAAQGIGPLPPLRRHPTRSER